MPKTISICSGHEFINGLARFKGSTWAKINRFYKTCDILYIGVATRENFSLESWKLPFPGSCKLDHRKYLCSWKLNSRITLFAHGIVKSFHASQQLLMRNVIPSVRI